MALLWQTSGNVEGAQIIDCRIAIDLPDCLQWNAIWFLGSRGFTINGLNTFPHMKDSVPATARAPRPECLSTRMCRSICLRSFVEFFSRRFVLRLHVEQNGEAFGILQSAIECCPIIRLIVFHHDIVITAVGGNYSTRISPITD